MDYGEILRPGDFVETKGKMVLMFLEHKKNSRFPLVFLSLDSSYGDSPQITCRNLDGVCSETYCYTHSSGEGDIERKLEDTSIPNLIRSYLRETYLGFDLGLARPGDILCSHTGEKYVYLVAERNKHLVLDLKTLRKETRTNRGFYSAGKLIEEKDIVGLCQ